MEGDSENQVNDSASRVCRPTRDLAIDFFRTIGILCIILAHCKPPKIINEIRNFDVPFMVFISGYCASSFSVKHRSHVRYIIDRFIRLVIPTWIFTTLYFIIRFTAGSPVPSSNVISTYLMLDQAIIGVWIIRVFFFLSLLTPLVGYLSKHCNSFIVLVIILPLNGLFLYLMRYMSQSELLLQWYQIFLLYNLSYGYVLFAGFSWNSWNMNHKLIHLLIFSASFILIGVYLFVHHGTLISISTYKFPPDLYYLSYALLLSMTLFLLKDLYFIKIIANNSISAFIGSHCLWIYLWHFFYLHLYNYFFVNTGAWYLLFIILVSVSFCTTYIQSKVIDHVTINYPYRVRRVLMKIFIG